MDKGQVVYLMHLIGIFMVFMSFGGAVIRSSVGDNTRSLKLLVGITFGIGMLLVLFGGMSLMAHFGHAKAGIPPWIWTKMALWAVFAAAYSLIMRKPSVAKTMWVGLILLGGIAVYMVYGRPF